MDKYSNIWPMTDTADLFVRIGFCPDVVKLTNLNDGRELIWNRCDHAHYQGAASAGGLARDVTGGVALTTSAGIKLCTFTDTVLNTTSDPSYVDGTNWQDANGIAINSTVALLATDKMLLIEAWRMDYNWLKAYHDGTTSNNTYFEDSSYDFQDLGVCGNGNWLIYNQTNGNYAYIKDVKKGSNGKHCRLYTATDQEGTATSSADFDTNDVCFVFPADAACYPLSDIGMMT